MTTCRKKVAIKRVINSYRARKTPLLKVIIASLERDLHDLIDKENMEIILNTFEICLK